MSSDRDCAPHARRFALRLEALESRDVPAGNVHVMVGDGILYVAGDGAANQIEIAGAGTRAVVIRALDTSTTINGQSNPLFVGGIKRGYHIEMNGGDDVLIIRGTRANGTLNVDMGEGNNILGITDAGHRRETVISSGSGNDIINLHASAFRRPVYLNTGFGDDVVNTVGIGSLDFWLVSGGGNNFFNDQGSTLPRPNLLGFTRGLPPAPVDTAPPIPTISTTAPDPTNSSSIAFTASFDKEVTGFVATDLLVTNGTVSAFTQLDARTYTFQVAPAGQGVVTVSVAAGAATDANGNANVASNTLSRTFDSVAPSVTINALTSNDTTPAITGTVNDATATVQVTVNNQTLNATVIGNTWTATVINTLTDGTYSVTAVATDPAGNTGSATLPAGLIVDATPPAAPQFDLATASDSGPVGDFRTDAAVVTLTGTAEAGATVQLFRLTVPGAPGAGMPIAQTTAANGSFSFNAVSLEVGPNSFAVRAVDAAGNLGATFALTFTRNTAPTVVNPIGSQMATAGGADLTFDLTDTFADAERVVRLATAYPTGQTGGIDIHLFADEAPGTVANFLAYVNSGLASQNYDGSIFHRLVEGFVLQGGGFKFDDAGTTTATAFPELTKFAPIANEPGVSNTRGTIAMAKGGTPDSATSEFFFNLGDNSANLDVQNGGFTVFGQVMNGGQQVVDAIVALPTFPGPGLPGAPPFPLAADADTTNFPANIDAGDLAFVTSATELSAEQRMTFSVVGNTDDTVATASVSNGTLTITPLAAGTTTVTVRATDLDGSSTDTQITVHVS